MTTITVEPSPPVPATTRGQVGFALVRILAGLLLIGACLLKAHELLTVRSAQVSWLASQGALEWLAGFWLLHGGYPRILRGAGLGLFLVFGLVAGWKWLTHQSSCGCFGLLEVPPALTLLLDGLTAAGFWATWRHARQGLSTLRIATVFGGVLPAGLLILLGSLAAAGDLPVYGLSEAALTASQAPATNLAAAASQPGEVTLVDLGYIEPKSVHDLAFRIHNPTKRPLAITKAENECSCIQLREVPKLIPREQGALIPVHFAAPDTRTRYVKRVVLFTEDPQRPTIPLYVRARVGMPLALDPELLRIPAADAASVEDTVTFINDGPTPVRLLYSTSTRPGTFLSVPREPVAPGAKVAMKVVVGLPGPLGRKQTLTIQLKTNHPDQGALDLTVQLTPGRR